MQTEINETLKVTTHAPSSRGLTAGSKSKIKNQNTGFPVSTGNDGEQLPLKHSKKYLPIFMWILCAIFYAYEYFLQVSPGVMAPDLMRSFGINAASLGNLAACYFYAYAVMQIPVGLIMDRLGARFPLMIAAFLCAIGCFLFGGTTFSWVTLSGRLLIGVGSAFAIVGSMYVISMWFNPKRFALFNGMLVTIGMLGAASGQAPLAWVINFYGWRNTMMFLGVFGSVIAIFIWMIIRDKTRHGSRTERHNVNIYQSLKHVLQKPQIWLLAAYGVLMYMPTSVLGALWGVPFFMHKYQISNATAGGIVTFLFLGWAAGCPLFGWISDQIRRRKVVMYIANIGTLLSIVFIIYVPITLHYTINMLLLFIFGFFSSGFVVSFAAVKENSSAENLGAALGFMNMINMVGGAVFQPLIGWFLDLQWHGAMAQGVRTYSTVSYQLALTVIPIGMIIAFMVLFFIKETYCKRSV